MSDLGDSATDEPTDQETVASRIARAGDAPEPGHPAEGASAVSGGEATSRSEEPTDPTGP
jgi:hypothetical protein